MMSSLVMNNILRYEGKASFAMIGLVTRGLLNIALDNYGMSGLPGWNYQGELERNRNWCGGCYRRNRQDCQAVLFNAGKSVR